MYKAIAYQIATHIDLKKSKGILNGSLLFSDSDELFYRIESDKFIYIFQYGMLCCFNMTEAEIESQFQYLKPACRNYIEDKISEKLHVVVMEGELKVGFNEVVLPKLDEVMIRLVMLNASQSVALNRYSEVTENLLNQTNSHTSYLEKNGKLDISGNKLKRFIGKTLNIKNQITENLYIFDSPEITWDVEKLNTLNTELKKTFDLKDRYHYIHDRIEIIKENLELFKDIMDHRESSRLEWIIILLILVEVVDMFILKFI